MPAMSKLVRKALLALVSNAAKAAVVFDSFKGAVSRLITSSDLIFIIKSVYHGTTNEKLLNEPLDSILSEQDLNGSSGSCEIIFAELDDW
uniref:Uncharacterized protein n=1 Tax=Romanomermis culicivorax TaxID=13658 RepID=A0A915HM93_ROMCU